MAIGDSNEKHHRSHAGAGRAGARQPEKFDSRRADLLDDASRFAYLPPEKIFALLDPPPGGCVVDFGAGTGTYSILLARARRDITVIAFDEQPEMLGRLRAKPESRQLRNLRAALSDEIGNLRGCADRVLLLNVLHELGDAAIEDLGSMLKAGGFAICMDWNAEVDRPVGPPKDHVYTTEEAIARLQSAGFSAEALDPLPYHFALRFRRA
jgi:SAM-dependent methyltransferase